ncbi:MAG TPA: type II toxin-antitoxin system RelE/ParE family toxin [Hyphomicrobiales bacterium]|nr:type II toxin-antitoxin system RelE/ParE family toxin [Hyphomicrobiales bacterium]
MKPVRFLGDSLARLRAVPERPRRALGFQIDRLQRGLDPDDWKPLRVTGPGVREIRVRDTLGAFRAIYIATLPEAIYVLHVFQKKTQATSQRDLDLAAARLKDLSWRSSR